MLCLRFRLIGELGGSFSRTFLGVLLKCVVFNISSVFCYCFIS